MHSPGTEPPAALREDILRHASTAHELQKKNLRLPGAAQAVPGGVGPVLVGDCPTALGLIAKRCGVGRIEECGPAISTGRRWWRWPTAWDSATCSPSLRRRRAGEGPYRRLLNARRAAYMDQRVGLPEECVGKLAILPRKVVVLALEDLGRLTGFLATFRRQYHLPST